MFDAGASLKRFRKNPQPAHLAPASVPFQAADTQRSSQSDRSGAIGCRTDPWREADLTSDIAPLDGPAEIAAIPGQNVKTEIMVTVIIAKRANQIQSRAPASKSAASELIPPFSPVTLGYGASQFPPGRMLGLGSHAYFSGF